MPGWGKPLIWLLLAVVGCEAMFHNLDISNDDRPLFKIETFCFEQGGFMNITIRDFECTHEGKDKEVRAGFIMVKTTSESQLQQLLEESAEEETCILDGAIFKDANLMVDMSSTADDVTTAKRFKKTNKNHIVKAGDEGLYSLIFARCKPAGLDGAKVNFRLNAAFWNPGPNYLSACEKQLPSVFLFFFLCFASAGGMWGWLLWKRADHVHSIHKLMMALVGLKCLALLFDSVRYHYIALTGSAEAWSIVYYIITFFKSLLLFTVILLIGTGWSLVKPYLNDREKKIVFFVLILQVLDNIALVVLEEMAPGSQDWYTWRDVLHLVDIVCCCAILFPIVWSIRHLRQAAGADGKAEHNLMKLTLFRQFYIMVVSYIYFTRIIVFLLAATMPYNWMWLRFFCTEAATLLFYVVTGFKFMPADENPYLKLSKEDDDADENDNEYGLEDEAELEMTEQLGTRVNV